MFLCLLVLIPWLCIDVNGFLEMAVPLFTCKNRGNKLHTFHRRTSSIRYAIFANDTT